RQIVFVVGIGGQRLILGFILGTDLQEVFVELLTLPTDFNLVESIPCLGRDGIALAAVPITAAAFFIVNVPPLGGLVIYPEMIDGIGFQPFYPEVIGISVP